ncbi:glycoside hydrolase family 3 protein [Paenibacillus sp. FSL R7-0331]|uniref:glycoside hydrolase family 3 protein n=1 Tax=Paenibacillus sp. FSL R7-0331 TaxID=1536773 RepID=UPI0004F7AADC|nr:glycoside hydrolase family 3 N-terminal domain-containing protein [Paenibacillus sp. FSL R7-0331]AIQ51287.1 beta-hexosaminidase [Paenibacillus sp. FSL R7-0331]
MTDLKAKPFYLQDEDIEWVNQTLAGMTLDEKVGQLFCLIAYTSEEEQLRSLARDVKAGGVMCRPMPTAEAMDTIRILQENSKIPMLISANLEAGGNGIAVEGTRVGSHMQIAATEDDSLAYKAGAVCGREGSAVGANWGFAPIIDIDYNFRNPITNTRTFGSDPERVRRMGAAYAKGMQDHGVAASVKHFPGDGVDELDQHLAISINGLSTAEWDQTYGKAYEHAIGEGALTVMIGHIMQPAYSRYFNPALTDEELLPASLSYDLTTRLLKEKLGFNGLVVTDASSMAGMVIPMHRSKAVPQAIAAGCDMFLFTRNMEEDLSYMKQGIEDGTITPERLEDALRKILALKASLGLHRKKQDGTLIPNLETARQILAAEEHKAWAQEIAARSITLVKEEGGVLPLSPAKHRRVLLYPLQSGQSYFAAAADNSITEFKQLLEQKGFEVEQFNPSKGMEGLLKAYQDYVDQYDVILYVATLATKSNQTTVRIEWAQPMGADVPVFQAEIPTVFISLENPYHLLDVPRVKTFINTYGTSDIVLRELVDKLTGNSEFRGISPVDPFCGRWDARI